VSKFSGKKLDLDQHKNECKSPILTCTVQKNPQQYLRVSEGGKKYEEQPTQTNYFAVTS
jgi:hypothetical protein